MCRQAGRTTAFTTSSSTTARTRIPAGAGGLLVTTVLTPSGSSVTLSGWTKAYDAVSGTNGLRLSAWYRTGTAGGASVTATVTPAARVSMITTAFDGASSSAPVSSAAAVRGLVPPSATVAAGGQRVTAVGVRTAHRARARGSADGNARVVVNGNTRLTQQLSAGQGAVSASPSTRQALAAVAGALSVMPGPAASVPAGALALTPGGTTTATCDGMPLTYAVREPHGGDGDV